MGYYVGGGGWLRKEDESDEGEGKKKNGNGNGSHSNGNGNGNGSSNGGSNGGGGGGVSEAWSAKYKNPSIVIIQKDSLSEHTVGVERK